MTVSILITRPWVAAHDFERKLRARLGDEIKIHISPIIEIRHLAPQLDLEDDQVLVFTSSHAVHALANLAPRHSYDCYVVGSATEKTARDAGFLPINAGGTAEALATRILKDRPERPLHYFRGRHVAFDLADALKALCPEMLQTIIYDQCEKVLTPEASQALSNLSGVILPLFSPRSAQIFFDSQSWRAPLFVAAMSENVAARVPKGRIERLSVATNPTSEAMLDETEQLWMAANRLEGNSSAQ